MRNYTLYNDKIHIVNDDGSIGVIFFNNFSGKIYYRYKINTPFGTKHPAIYLGYDSLNQHWYIHNHYQIGRASLVREDEFSKGQQIYDFEENCSNPPLTIIDIGLRHILAGEPYDFYGYNCQTLINRACNNENRSQSVEMWGKGLFFGGLLLLGLGIASAVSSK